MRSASSFPSTPVSSPFAYTGRKLPLGATVEHSNKQNSKPLGSLSPSSSYELPPPPGNYIESFSLENLPPPPPPPLELLNDLTPQFPPQFVAKPVSNVSLSSVSPSSSSLRNTSPHLRVNNVPMAPTKPQNVSVISENGKRPIERVRYSNPDSCDELSSSSRSDTDGSSSSDEDSEDINIRRRPRPGSPSDSSSYTTTTDEEEERDYEMDHLSPCATDDPLARILDPIKSEDEPLEVREITSLSQLAKFTSEETRHTDKSRGLPGFTSLAPIRIPTRSNKPSAANKGNAEVSRTVGLSKAPPANKVSNKSSTVFKPRSRGLPIIFERSESVESSKPSNEISNHTSPITSTSLSSCIAEEDEEEEQEDKDSINTRTNLVVNSPTTCLLVENEDQRSINVLTNDCINVNDTKLMSQVNTSSHPSKSPLVVKRVDTTHTFNDNIPLSNMHNLNGGGSGGGQVFHASQNTQNGIHSSTSASDRGRGRSVPVVNQSNDSVSSIPLTNNILHDAWSTSESKENDIIRSNGVIITKTLHSSPQLTQNLTNSSTKWKGYGRPQFTVSSVSSSGNTNSSATQEVSVLPLKVSVSTTDSLEMKGLSVEPPSSTVSVPSVKSIINRFNQDRTSSNSAVSEASSTTVKSTPGIPSKPKPIIPPKPPISTVLKTSSTTPLLLISQECPSSPQTLQETSIDDDEEKDVSATVSLSSSISINTSSSRPQSTSSIVSTRNITTKQTSGYKLSQIRSTFEPNSSLISISAVSTKETTKAFMNDQSLFSVTNSNPPMSVPLQKEESSLKETSQPTSSFESRQQISSKIPYKEERKAVSSVTQKMEQIHLSFVALKPVDSMNEMNISKEKEAEWKRLREKSASQRSNEITDNIIVMDRAIDRVSTHISSIDTTLGKMHTFNSKLYKTLENLSDDDVELDIEAVQLESHEVQTEPFPKLSSNIMSSPSTFPVQTVPQSRTRQQSSSESTTSSSDDTSDSSADDGKDFNTSSSAISSAKLSISEKMKQVSNSQLSSHVTPISKVSPVENILPKPPISKAAPLEVPTLSNRSDLTTTKQPSSQPPIPTPRRSTNDPNRSSLSDISTTQSIQSLDSSNVNVSKEFIATSSSKPSMFHSPNQDTKRASLFKKKTKPIFGNKTGTSNDYSVQKQSSSSVTQPMHPLRAAEAKSQPNLLAISQDSLSSSSSDVKGSSSTAGKGINYPSSVTSSVSERPIIPTHSQGATEPKPFSRKIKPRGSGQLSTSKSFDALNESKLSSHITLDGRVDGEDEDDLSSGSSLEGLEDERYHPTSRVPQHGSSKNNGRVEMIGGSLASLNSVGQFADENGALSDAEILLRLRRYLETGQQQRARRLLSHLARQDRLQTLIDHMDDATYQLLEGKLQELGLSLSAFMGDGDSESIFNRATSISDLRSHLQPGVRSTETRSYLFPVGNQLIQQPLKPEPGSNFLMGTNSIGTILRTVYCPLDAVEEPFPPMGVPPKPVAPQFLKSVIVQQAVMDKVDAIAQKVSTMDPTTFTELIRNLTQECSNEVEKVRAIFRWITLFDMTYVDFDPSASAESLIGLLRSIKCGQVSNNELFHKLCRYAGIFCEYVSGYSKGAGYRPGMVLKDNRMFRNIWCAVYVAKGWRFVNCNWGARYLSTLISDSHNYASSVTMGSVNPRMGTLVGAGSVHSLASSTSTFVSPSLRGGNLMGTINAASQQVRYRCDEFYFLTDPGQHIFEHFPDNKRWQLLKKCITMEQFMRMPIVKSPFFNAGMSFKKNYADTLITKNGSVTIKIYMPRFVAVSCTLENRTDLSTIKGVTLVRIVDDLVIITSSPAQPGKYYLNVYIRENWQGDEMSPRELGCSFQVHCSEHNYERLMIGRYPTELDEGYLGRTPHAQRYGVVLGDSHNRSVDPYIVWNEKDTLTIPFVISPGLKISHQMRSYDRPGQQAVNCSSYAFLQTKASKSFYCVRFPVDAFYFLVIYAAPLRLEENQPHVDRMTTMSGISSEDLECVYYLLIDCRKAQEGIPPFPRMSSLWCGNYLAEPTQQHLLLNKRYKFRVEAPLFHKVSVVINGGMQWIDLKQTKSNSQWAGKVHVGDQLGELSIYGLFRSSIHSITMPPEEEVNNDDEGEFEKLLTYVLVQKIT